MCLDHEEPCGPNHRSFCLNGGICYLIPTIPSPFNPGSNPTSGSRCMEPASPSAYVSASLSLTEGPPSEGDSVQYDINLVETSTGAQHSFQDLGHQETKDHDS
ncbi:unnamed protein product [Nyctereutes procyonoides]|uniref:(raccoon dog) hypothetical protein n=1 Tax=Nyctereutes procyonoides TaxID=34880 RepID=A0A811Y4T5_NYCPR|nr:unnamed protein product [Nyctereutes procyonoides]